MASKTILCQAVLTAKGGHEEAHFMRYVAFTHECPKNLSYGISFALCTVSLLCHCTETV